MRYVSIFSGIEAASVAWDGLGWEPVAFSEIDPFACAVLAHRFPDVPNLGDITQIDWEEFHAVYGTVDLVVGGSPCQSFSIAGDRSGLAGASGLMWEYVRAIRGIMPDWVVWENVPGALSSSKGEDFRCLLESLDELGYGLAWRVLDAQFFGVAQRRRRVFLVGHLGDMRAADVLFEPESLRWDHRTGREKRQELAADTGNGAAGPIASGFKYHAGESAGSIGYGDISPTLTADYHQPACLTPWDVQSKRIFPPSSCVPMLSSGTGEGANIQPCVLAFAQNSLDKVRIVNGDGQISGALSASPGMKQTTYVVTTCNTNANGSNVSEDTAYALDSTNGNAVVYGFAGEHGGNTGFGISSDSAPTITADHAPSVFCVADDNASSAIYTDLCGTLKVGGGSSVNSNGEDVTGALCARDYKGVGSQYASEGKVVCQKARWGVG